MSSKTQKNQKLFNFIRYCWSWIISFYLPSNLSTLKFLFWILVQYLFRPIFIILRRNHPLSANFNPKFFIFYHPGLVLNLRLFSKRLNIFKQFMTIFTISDQKFSKSLRNWSTPNSTQLNSTKWRVIMIIGVYHHPTHAAHRVIT